MTRCRNSILLLLLCSFSSAGQSAKDAGLPPAGIPRFHEVSEGFYRGGQPTATGFEYLQGMGVKTVINLRHDHEEKAIVEKLGMRYVHIPTRSSDPIPDEAIRTFFGVLRDPKTYPVFVHCKRGADRTGAAVGLYRIAFQGWDGKKAYQEARALGMRWWYRDLKKQLYGFAAKYRRAGVSGVCR